MEPYLSNNWVPPVPSLSELAMKSIINNPLNRENFIQTLPQTLQSALLSYVLRFKKKELLPLFFHENQEQLILYVDPDHDNDEELIFCLAKEELNLIPNCKNLTHLDVSSSTVTHELLDRITLNCTKLCSLEITCCDRIVNPFLLAKSISLLPGLTSLCIGGNQFDLDSIIYTLAKTHKQLISLDLGSSKLSDEQIEILVTNCSNLTSLNLTTCIFSNEALETICGKLPNIEKLNLSYVETIDTIQPLLSLTNLRLLGLSGCDNLPETEEETLTKILNNNLGLEKLYLCSGSYITEDHLKIIGKLEYLDTLVLACKTYENYELLKHLKHCTSLQNIILDGDYDTSILVDIIPHLTNLVKLNLLFTNINEEVVYQILKKKPPKLQKIYFPEHINIGYI